MKPILLCALILLLGASSAGAEPPGISIEPPEGWIEVENESLRTEMAKRNLQVLFVAESPEQDVTAVCTISPWTDDYNQSTFDENTVRKFLGGYRKSIESAGGEFVSEKILDINGIPARHLEFLLNTPNGELKLTSFLLLTINHHYNFALYTQEWLSPDHPHIAAVMKSIKILNPSTIPSKLSSSRFDSKSDAFSDGYVVGDILAEILLYGGIPLLIVLIVVRKHTRKRMPPGEPNKIR